jgi:type I restriction enzyme S subunit
MVRSNTQDNLNAETVGNAAFPGIRLAQQHAIADYLDAETARIDAIAAASRGQLGLLALRKRATVSDVLKTHSAVRVPVRRLVTTVTSGPRGWSCLEVEGSTQLFLRIANVPADSIGLKLKDVAFINAPGGDESDRCRVRSGDVLTTITAAIGQVAVVPVDLGEAYVSQHLALLRPDRALVMPEWLALALWSDDAQRQLDAARYGGTKQQLSLDDVREVRVPFAEMAVQEIVVPRVMAALESMTKAEQRIRRVIALLLERRQALITAAVTG